jgi:hypothetical protein
MLLFVVKTLALRGLQKAVGLGHGERRALQEAQSCAKGCLRIRFEPRA